MADLPRMALMDVLRTAAADPDVDFLREALRVVTQELMEAEVEAHLGADRSERPADRTGQRNGERAGLGHARGQYCLAGATRARLQLLSHAPGATHARQASTGGGDPSGLSRG